MKSTFKALFLALTMALFVLPAVSTNAADINNIPAPDYTLKYTVDKSDTFIYSYNVKDFGAVSDGVTDNTNIFQKLLNKLGDLGGGTLYVPTGKYVIKGNLTIPKGVNFTMYYHFYVLQKKHTPPRNIQIPTQCMLL